MLGLRVNGFVAEHSRLDLLREVAGQVADGLAAMAAPTLAPQPFSAALPPPAPATWPFGIPEPQPFEADALRRLAAELAMVPEDPVAFHRAHPACPVPGRALGVVAGVLPGSSASGRVGVFDQGRHTGGTYRSAVMVPARPGAATPLGGTLDRASDLYVEIAGGVAHAWPRNRSRGAFDAAATIERALPTLRTLDLADV